MGSRGCGSLNNPKTQLFMCHECSVSLMMQLFSVAFRPLVSCQLCRRRAAQNGRVTHEQQLVAKAGGKLEKDREEDDRSEGKSDSDGWRGIGNPPSRLSTLSFAAGFASAGRQLDGDVGWRRGFMLPFPGGHSRRLGTRWDPAGAAGRPMHGPYAYAWATARPLCSWASLRRQSSSRWTWPRVDYGSGPAAKLGAKDRSVASAPPAARRRKEGTRAPLSVAPISSSSRPPPLPST